MVEHKAQQDPTSNTKGISTSAQDQALHIPEILSHIFDHLAIPLTCLDDVSASTSSVQLPNTHQNNCRYCRRSDHQLIIPPPSFGDEIVTRRKSLRAAALCCRRFSGPALDALWRTMKSLFPLISVLPLNTVNNTAYLRLSQCNSAIWDRFSLYANRIQTLVVEDILFTNTRSISVHPSLSSAVQTFRPRLLPFLRTLLLPSFSGISQPSFDVSLLVFSTVTRLEFGQYTGALEAQDAFILTTLARAGSLTHTSFNCGLSEDIQAEIIENLADIQSLTLSAPVRSLSKLSSLHDMQRLDINVNFGDRTLPKRFSIPTLKNLSVRGPFTSVNQFLLIWGHNVDLVSLSIHLDPSSSTHPQPAQMKSLIDSIAQIWGETLLHFRLDCNDIRGYWSSIVMLSREFEALFLPKLLTFEVENCYGLNDPSIKLAAIASRLPAIQSLVLPSGQPGQEATLDTLRSLTQTCPSLRRLSISVDVNSEMQHPSTLPFIEHELDTLHVYASNITDPWAVAANLDRTFPYLRKITTSPTIDATVYTKWRDVEKALALCHSSRAGFQK